MTIGRLIRCSNATWNTLCLDLVLDSSGLPGNGDGLMMKWILNVFLAAVVAFFAVNIYEIWTRPDPPAEDAAGTSGQKTVPSPRASIRRQVPATHYDVIPQKNLFTVERGEGAGADPVVATKAAETSRYAKQIALYGVIVKEDDRSALLGSGRSRRSAGGVSWVRVGDRVGQVTVVGIETDRILVREGTSTFEIRLDSRDHPLKRSKVQQSQTPTVVTSKGTTKGTTRKTPRAPKPEKAPAQPAKAKEGQAATSKAD